MKTEIIAGFPGIGKSYLYKYQKGITILDSDSSTFSKDDFPNNYIAHIKENIGKVDIIMVSTHEDVRHALKENNIPYTLVYPSIDLKENYLKRYDERGSNQSFIGLIKLNWEYWISDMEDETFPKHIVLTKHEYLEDALIEDALKGKGLL